MTSTPEPPNDPGSVPLSLPGSVPLSLPGAVPLSLPGSVRLDVGRGGLDRLRVETSAGTGEVYLHGATVTAWTPTGHDPVIWVSREAVFAPDAAIRGGIPLCCPWFGPGRAGDRPWIHGFVRTAPWRLIEAVETRNAAGDGPSVTLTLEVTGRECPKAGPEYADAVFTCRVTFAETLTVTLAARAGTTPLDLEAAIHTYVVVGDVRRAHVEGLSGCSYVDKTTGGTIRTLDGPLTFTAETDAVITSTGPARLVDPVLGRTITVTQQGAGNVVVWNPWADKAAAMADFGDDEWPGMACVETANAFDNARIVEPGASYAMTSTIGVRRDR